MITALLVALVLAVASPAASRTAFPAAPARPIQSVTDGVRTLQVSQADGLDPNGQSITVTGSGFDVNKGIYLAYCLEPLPGEIPSPCGGGVDMDGSTGSSAWISSNPPAYGEGLAIPYGGGGSFSYTIAVNPMIGSIDCRRAQCVIATRNDHTRATDRSQDLFVPLAFAQPGTPDPGPGDPGPGDPDPQPTEPTTTTTTVPRPLPDEERAAPGGEVSEDGREVTAGELSLKATKTADLDPEGEVVVVTGTGFDEERGIGVSFCAIGADGAPGPCVSDEKAAEIGDDAKGTLWVSSNPSEEREADSTAYGPSGSFGTGIGVVAQIDADTDCREVGCAIVTIAHPDRPSDAGQNLVLPVTFEVEEEPEATTTTAPATTTTAPVVDEEPEEGDGGGSNAIVPILIVVVLAAAVGGGLWYRSRNAAGATAAAEPEAEDTP